jgi:hypothetical protein
VKKSTYKIIIAAVITLPILFNSCIHNDFEEPEINTIPTGTYLNLDQIYQIYNDSVMALGKLSYKFTEDYSVTAVVVMDDKTGNLYKSAYIQDGSKGINLHLMSSGGLYEGDSVRVYLKGLILSEYAGMMQLDSVDVDKNIIKIATLKNVEPEVVTIDQIFTGQYIAKVIKLENVQFSDDDLGTTYADDVNLITMNKNLVDANGQTIIVRTSGYASFAGRSIPEGRGSIIAVVGKFNTDWQLFIRSTYEVNFDKNRFGEYDTVFYEGFASVANGTAINIENWKNIAATGALQWIGFNNLVDLACAKIDGTGAATETFLILPQQNLSNNKMVFSTRAGNLLNAKLELVVSTDYDGISNPSTATWTVLPASMSTAPTNGYASTWTNSGEVDLSSYSGNTYIAFRYTAEATQKGVFLLDDVLIYQE